MIVRHAEKPVDGAAGVRADGSANDGSLTVQGWQRAGALVGLFAPHQGAPRAGLATPARIYAAAPKTRAAQRPLETVTPLAARLGLSPDVRFAKGDEHLLAADLAATTGPVLVSWQHEDVHHILARLGTITPAYPRQWPDPRFDLVWVLTPQSGGGWAFTQVPQLLLAGDGADPA